MKGPTPFATPGGVDSAAGAEETWHIARLERAPGIAPVDRSSMNSNHTHAETTAAGPLRPLGIFAAAWGLGGVGALLLQAVLRLGPVAVEGLTAHPIAPWQWAIALGWLGFMAYSEGYRGFQLGFSPRVVSRALYLARRPRPLHVALAPLFCMGLIHASRRRLVVAWSLVFGIAGLVALVRMVEQPWRGIVDAGVVLGLVWGLVAIAVLVVRSLVGSPPMMQVELPEPRGGEG